MLDALAWCFFLKSHVQTVTCVSVCAYHEWGVGTMHVATHAGGGVCNDGKPGGSWLRTQALETCRTIVSTIYSWGP